MDNNLPDDCQGNNPNFPWNQIDNDETECYLCDEMFDDAEEMLEVVVNGDTQWICMDCVETEDYFELKQGGGGWQYES